MMLEQIKKLQILKFNSYYQQIAIILDKITTFVAIINSLLISQV